MQLTIICHKCTRNPKREAEKASPSLLNAIIYRVQRILV
jgi:hypothetical protein